MLWHFNPIFDFSTLVYKGPIGIFTITFDNAMIYSETRLCAFEVFKIKIKLILFVRISTWTIFQVSSPWYSNFYLNLSSEEIKPCLSYQQLRWKRSTRFWWITTSRGGGDQISYTFSSWGSSYRRGIANWSYSRHYWGRVWAQPKYLGQPLG